MTRGVDASPSSEIAGPPQGVGVFRDPPLLCESVRTAELRAPNASAGMGVCVCRVVPPKGEAVERYVLPELDLLFRAALGLTRNHSDAEDLVQETLLRAYRSTESFDGDHPRAWLLTVLRHAHINSHRRRPQTGWTFKRVYLSTEIPRTNLGGPGQNNMKAVGVPNG
jgi:hypothetical protein